MNLWQVWSERDCLRQTLEMLLSWHQGSTWKANTLSRRSIKSQNPGILSSSQQIRILQEAIEKSGGIFCILPALQQAVSVFLNIIKYPTSCKLFAKRLIRKQWWHMPYLSVFLVADAPGPSPFSLIFWSCLCIYSSVGSVPKSCFNLWDPKLLTLDLMARGL